MRALVVVLLWSATAAADTKPGPSAKELVDWVDAKLAAIDSLEIELETKLPGPPAPAYISTLTRTEVIQIVRSGGKLRSRLESTGITTHECKQPGCKRPMPEPPTTLIVLTDGDERIQYFAGALTAHKSKATSVRSNTLRLASWLRGAKLTRADAEGAYVLEVAEPTAVTTLFLSTTTGLPTKTVVRSKGTSVTTTTKRAEPGKRIPEERFSPPATVKIE